MLTDIYRLSRIRLTETLLPTFAIILFATFATQANATLGHEFTLIEAESLDGANAVADPAASGGKFIKRDGDYQPVAIAPLPSSGDTFEVWARVRGTALQLKGLDASGRQRELTWNWEKPSAWKWVSFGRHSRDELGSKILLMRGPGGSGNAGIDVIVFATGSAFAEADLPQPVAGTTPSPVDSTKVTYSPTSSAADHEYSLIEAESLPGTGSADSPEASGGHYAERSGAYRPVVVAPLPTTGESWTIWVRQRGLQLQLKGIDAAGAQHELNWAWEKPAEWKWVSFGSHTRAELGSKILFMRGPSGSSDGGIDAIVFATGKSFAPGEDVKSAAPTVRGAVKVSVDWTKTVATATSLSYGLNAFRGADPNAASDPAYQANMVYMHPGIVRLHHGGLMGNSSKSNVGWIDETARTWDAAKIRRALTGTLSYGPDLLINIPNWPAWMNDSNGCLRMEQLPEYAKLCADLVRIVNVTLKRNVKYWEVTNEQDGRYFNEFHENGGKLKDTGKPDRLDELVTIYNACTKAMKAVDPSIKVGGPATAVPWFMDFTRRFATKASDNLDFYSIHCYVSGNAQDSDKAIYDRTNGFGDVVAATNAALKAAIPQRTVPVFLDEYNISWSWEVRDPRMIDYRGVVFDALAMVSAVKGGAAATTAWNEQDGIYGKMDGTGKLRVNGETYALFNSNLVGEVKATSSDTPQEIVSYAVKNETRRALLLINRSANALRVDLPSDLAGNIAMIESTSIGKDGVTRTKVKDATKIEMPDHSITLLAWNSQ